MKKILLLVILCIVGCEQKNSAPTGVEWLEKIVEIGRQIIECDVAMEKVNSDLKLRFGVFAREGKWFLAVVTL